ncbi:MAG: hypothetical protein FJ145_15745 [Deltaproteobacteria bacterium]|nr:hypothetical protein [Deltaproteobacteria bacterium]
MTRSKNILIGITLTASTLFAGVAQASRVDWNMCYDTTTSVARKQFKDYPALARSSVLEFIAPGDRLAILRVDDLDVISVQLESRLSRFEPQVTKIFKDIKEIPQNKRNDTVSDFVAIFDHARQQIELNEKANGSKGAKYVLVCIADGVQDKKSKPTESKTQRGTIAADYRILFVGIHKGVEDALTKMAAEAGFTDQKKILLVPFEHAGQVDVAAFLGRSRNPSAVKALGQVGPN